MLKKKSDEYIARLEKTGNGVDYHKVGTDKLLILEALNDWSGRALTEGDAIVFNYGCDDPCCATNFELEELVCRMHRPVLLYPVSAINLSDSDELCFDFHASSFRMLPQENESRAAGIRIAETQHVKDVEAAMQLWAFCATEDSLAYLEQQLDLHGLYLETDEQVAIRKIVTSALINTFSIGQIWNAMWRASQRAAALSTRQYYNNAKAAKTVPKKIDQLLTQYAADTASVTPYERVISRPLGAVLTLMLNRFGINDHTPGPVVRSRLAADAALAEPKDEEDEYDEGRGLLCGTFFYLREFTELDRMILACFETLELDSVQPEWDEQYPMIGKIRYTLRDFYAFDGRAFGEGLLGMMNLPPLSDEAIERHAAAAAIERANTKRWVDESGWSQAFEEALVAGGVQPSLAIQIRRVTYHPTEMEEIVSIAPKLPLASGLVAIRMEHAHVYSGFMEHGDLVSGKGFYDFCTAGEASTGGDGSGSGGIYRH